MEAEYPGYCLHCKIQIWTEKTTKLTHFQTVLRASVVIYMKKKNLHPY